MASWGMSTTGTLHRPPRRPGLILGLLALSQVGVAWLWWRYGWALGLPVMAATHLLVVWATLYPRATVFCPALSRLPTDERVVWLTIDDGPSADTQAMLDLLDRHGAKATFFLVGERALAQPALVQAIRNRGHGIGNHSATHPDTRFWRLGPGALEDEIGRNQSILTAITGDTPRWYRSVVGMTNPFVGLSLKRHALARVAWSARGFDGVDCQPQQVLARITRDITPGAIVLLHEGATHGHNVAILAQLLAWLEVQGYRTVVPESDPVPAAAIAAA
ncbi:MAG TPA: polysaccharide deacetylase family protein [Pseudoxanthomonas sp.]|uniref:polysaccharide deacetylase family protein n=1 Tax=Pseudoxanthomonas japonensis TaxID=69284 RepID=UPI001BCCC097|nr:polysaccharide deacetylase family protein [Pseudoxanthomonas japonensis]MCR6625393.1 polysaccharide deacetylase family protein [Pseudoxanthomonas sp.]